MTNRTIVISAFPACGKSYTYSHFNGRPYTMLDSDSSKYSWIYKDGKKTDERNPNFISDYMNHIKENIGKVDVIFVSSHPEVRKGLTDNGIKYFLVYPLLYMKEEMIRRMKDRGNDEKFIQFQEEHFDEFVRNVELDYINLVNDTPYDTTCSIPQRHLPYILAPLSSSRPYIDNHFIDELLDNSMGNLNCLYWNMI